MSILVNRYKWKVQLTEDTGRELSSPLIWCCYKMKYFYYISSLIGSEQNCYFSCSLDYLKFYFECKSNFLFPFPSDLIYELTKKTSNMENHFSVKSQDFIKCRLLLKILWTLCFHCMTSGELKIILVRRYLSFSMLSRYTCLIIFDAIEKKFSWKKISFLLDA